MKSKKFATLLIAAILMAAHSYGAVVLQDSYAAAAPSGAPTDLGGGTFGYEFTLNPADFSAAGVGKLIFTGSTHEGVRDDANLTTITMVLYNGVELTEAVNGNDNWGMVSNSIFYLDNVASDGTLRVELTSSITQAMGFGLYAVDGLKAGVQDTGATTQLSVLANATVTMTTDSGFYVQQAARNNQSLSDSADDYETLYNYNVDNYRGLAQYQATTAAGDYLAPVNNAGANAGGAVAAAFEAVPEPSSTALLGLAGLALILRRRR